MYGNDQSNVSKMIILVDFFFKLKMSQIMSNDFCSAVGTWGQTTLIFGTQMSIVLFRYIKLCCLMHENMHTHTYSGLIV